MIDDYSKAKLTTAYQELDDCLGLLSKAAGELLRTPQCKYKPLADRVYELHAGICRLQESIMGIMIQAGCPVGRVSPRDKGNKIPKGKLS